VFVCVFARLWISPPRIKLAASNFARRFIGVQGGESHILRNLSSQKPKIGRICQRAGHLYDVYNNYLLASEQIARCVGVASACVDIRPSPKTDVLVGHFNSIAICGPGNVLLSGFLLNKPLKY